MPYNGVINVLKPTGMTSHDVVNKIRKITGQKKVGHTGTLDPDVAGVLPICVGKATRISSFLMEGNKTYISECVLGIITDTLDMYGEVLEEDNKISFSYQEVSEALNKAKNLKKQVPPMYSAVRYNGKKLYEYARKNQNVDVKERDINILDLKLKKYENQKIIFQAEVSKGTYMRVLCNDIGKILGTKGTMGKLIRIESKGLKIENSYTLEELEEKALNNELRACILPIETALKLESVNISIEDGKKIKNGVFINIPDGKRTIEYPFYVFSNDKLLGLGEIRDNKLKLKKQLC
jgi:tRNA pseudouridine55 synthase